MRLHLTLAVAAAFAAQSPAPQESEPLTLIVNPVPSGDTCEVHYFLVGSFGGYGGWSAATANGEYHIPTTQGGIPADRLKAYLQCTKYQVETIVFDSLPPPGNREVRRPLKPLSTVPFFGRVRGLTEAQRSSLTINVDFMTSWACGFFQLMDCSYGSVPVATIPMEADGTFRAELPDFANDPTIASFGPGDFGFRIRNLQTLNRLFELRPAASKNATRYVAVVPAYPGEQLFDAVPAR